ncbi:MAG: thioredoxin [Candidatus Omnitrophota bacterium]|nr:thioredoxin [Candidatus Omnitrophota bacterium]
MEIILNETNFDQEIKEGALPFLVDFWAQWCGPCQMLGPILDQIATDFKGRVCVGKVNVDENPNLAGKFGVMSIPTLILFVGGQEKERLVGVVPKERLIQLLENSLGAAQQ